MAKVVIIDNVPKVSTGDGEPHEILTMAAVGSGSIVAAILLIILFLVIKKHTKKTNDQPTASTETSEQKPQQNVFWIEPNSEHRTTDNEIHENVRKNLRSQVNDNVCIITPL